MPDDLVDEGAPAEPAVEPDLHLMDGSPVEMDHQASPRDQQGKKSVQMGIEPSQVAIQAVGPAVVENQAGLRPDPIPPAEEGGIEVEQPEGAGRPDPAGIEAIALVQASPRGNRFRRRPRPHRRNRAKGHGRPSGRPIAWS